MTNERKHSSPAQHLAQLGDRMGGPDMKRSPIKEQAEELRRILCGSGFLVGNIEGELFGFGHAEGQLKEKASHESVDEILQEAIGMAKFQLTTLRGIRNGIDGRDDADEDDKRG